MKSFSYRVLLLGLVALLGVGCCSSDEPKTPRNLIFMVGDGMGLAHVSMLMIEKGYQPTAFDAMQNVALMTTYSANNRVTDSAAAGTALATGFKTGNSMLGISLDSVVYKSIIERAEERGMATGIVVTSEIQHATPASFYAHSKSRSAYDIINGQLTESGVDVIFGGGRESFDFKADSTKSAADIMREKGYGVYYDIEEALACQSTPVVGVFAEGHLSSMLKGRGDYLPRATHKALELLSGNEKGFVLMVEGSQIDFESHGNSTEGILAEVSDFEAAVREAIAYVDAHPQTLLVVAADHETGGLAIPSGKSDFTLSESGIHYTYGSGSHTGVMVPVYLYGKGAESVNGVIDNTELSRRLVSLLGLE